MKTSILKDYRVLNKLGQGGMGMVYLAEDVALGRQVALKFLAPYLVQDPEIMGRFRSEARNQARLVHPHITVVFTFQEFEDQAFLVLEYLGGETLESRIKHEGKIPVSDSLVIMRDILSAVGYAHKKGVVHRDIKPGNIGFSSDNRVKLMDFGIALDVDETQRLTRTGHTLGTPHYMAPEQILGQPTDGRADIYALGITLFEMLTGKVPFEGSDYEVRVAQINHQPPSPCEAGCPELTPAIEKVVLKALAKDPTERFATAGEFRKALEAAAALRPPEETVKQAKGDRATETLPRLSPAPQTANAAAEPPPPIAASSATGLAVPPVILSDEITSSEVETPPAAEPTAAPLSVTKPGRPGWRVWLPVSLGLAVLAGVGLFLDYQKVSDKSKPPKVTATRAAPAAIKTSESSGAEKSQPPSEKPKALPALPAMEPKPAPKQEPPKLEAKSEPPPEIKAPKIPSPPPPDYQKMVREELTENGFSALKVTQDEKHRITVSGAVKSQSQKDKVIQVVSAAEVAVPVNYKLAVVSDKRSKPAPPRRPREVVSEIPESPRKPSTAKSDTGALSPGAGDIQRKPLPPRLD